jgi:hypothetical protein
VVWPKSAEFVKAVLNPSRITTVPVLSVVDAKTVGHRFRSETRADAIGNQNGTVAVEDILVVHP